MEWLPILAVIVGAILSGILSLMVGMALNKLGGIEKHLELLNGKVFAHLTKDGIHESAVARIDERIANLLKTIEVAHERIDSLKME